jgi:polysaccharide biosynthesis protein PslH
MTGLINPRCKLVAGKSIVIIHPAWHSCGSHAVFCAQAAAYKALNANVMSLAVGTTLDRGSHAHRFWSEYYAMTSDLGTATRFHTGPSRVSYLASPGRLRSAFELLSSNYARQLAGLAELSPIPRKMLQSAPVDLIHCNHYFNIPLALRLKAITGAQVLLDTHDIQARQFELSGEKAKFNRRRASFEEMLETELSFLRRADYLVHINSEEYEFFKDRLPDNQHKLIYPPISIPFQARNDLYFLIVASGNYGNYESVAWFLDEVMPLCPNIRVKIAGNVDGYFAAQRPDLLHKYRSSFLGRVESLSELYEDAVAILLPTISGHGLSIKTLEALSTGLPIIAMPCAFRGISINFTDYPNVHLVDSAETFARSIFEQYDAVSDLTSGQILPDSQMKPWPTSRRLHQRKAQTAFNRRFSFRAYKDNLAAVAHELLNASTSLSGKEDWAIGRPSTSSIALRA